MQTQALIVLSFLLVASGILIIILGFFRNFGRQVQKIKIQKFGVDLEVNTMSLWLLLGFSLALVGAYPVALRQAGAVEKYDATFFLLEAEPATLAQVRCVEYTLHPTFPNPIQVVCNPQKNFALTASGWGTFEVKLRVLFKDGSILPLTHQLRF